MSALPDGLILTHDVPPAAELRTALAREINDFHSRTVSHAAERFALSLRDAEGVLRAGMVGSLAWDWLYIEALWVDDGLRGQGVGRDLMKRAEGLALAAGCHSAWLDTFQARAFYEALGYEVFGALDHYPADQVRSFMRRRLTEG